MSNSNDANNPKTDSSQQDLGRPVGQQDIENKDNTLNQDSSTTQVNSEDSKQEPLENSAAIPWYVSPWFWGFLIFLAILALLAWLFWLQWQAHLALQSRQEALVLAQQTRNKELETHLLSLRSYLNYDPCDLKKLLESKGILLLMPNTPTTNPTTSGEPLQIPSELVRPSGEPLQIPSELVNPTQPNETLTNPLTNSKSSDELINPPPPPTTSQTGKEQNIKPETKQSNDERFPYTEPESGPPPPKANSGDKPAPPPGLTNIQYIPTKE